MWTDPPAPILPRCESPSLVHRDGSACCECLSKPFLDKPWTCAGMLTAWEPNLFPVTALCPLQSILFSRQDFADVGAITDTRHFGCLSGCCVLVGFAEQGTSCRL